jgi:glycosyltransferase involved in cell wall biosynthesis
MRILVAHNVPRARTGGMSRIMGEIHDRIAAKGAHVEYFCSDDVPPRYQNKWQRFTYPYLVAQRAREGKFDILNVHEPAGALAPFLKSRVKVTVTSHGVEQRGWEISLEDRKLGRGGPSSRTQVLYPLTSLWQSRVALTRADHVFCLNTQDRDFLISRFAVSPNRITRIFPAASPVYAEQAAARDYSRFRRILFAGTWLTRKGNRDAIAAFVQSDPMLQFATLGAGASAQNIRACFPEALRHRVIVIEAKSDREAAQAMAEADAFLLPSVFEGTPLTLMEAMYSALPIITTDTCGMRDVITHNQNGLLVPLRAPGAIAEAITTLKNDPVLRERLGRNAQQLATGQYTWAHSAEPVWRVYQELLQGR